MKIDFTKEQLLDLYSNTSSKGRDAIKSALGEDLSEVLPITDRVKTFEDAVNELGEEHPDVRAYNAVKYGYSGISEETHPDILAYLKLRIITVALNEGWHPQFIEDERRWYGWYDIVSQDEYDKMSDACKSECRCVGRSDGNAYAVGGLVYSDAGSASSSSHAYGGSRLAFKSEELAEYAAKQFVEIYADFCFIPKSAEKKA